MRNVLSLLNRWNTKLSALAAVALCLQTTVVVANSLTELQTDGNGAEPASALALPLEQRALITYDAYILGPGDGLQIEILDLPELSGSFSIGPDGTLYLPRLRALYVEGFTVEELRTFLKQQYSTYVRDPQIYVQPVAYRPIRVYVGGEVKRPGYYTLTGVQSTNNEIGGRTFLKKSNTAETELEATQIQSQVEVQASRSSLPYLTQSAAHKA